MTCILYRKSSISLAFQTNSFLRGCNLFVWYGFTDANHQKDIIIDATIIKEYLKTDLAKFDHTCFSTESVDDIVSFMVFLGRKIYNEACTRKSFIQLVVENEYGDIVVFSHNHIEIHKHFVRSNEGAYFSYSSNNPFALLGAMPKHCVISSTTNFTDKQLNDLLNGNDNNICIDITFIDDVTSTATTFKGNDLGWPIRFSVSCRGQFAHQIVDIASSEKCNRLHGHTYKCCVSAFSTKDISSANHFIKTLGRSVDDALNEAFMPDRVSQNTVENVARFIANRLSQSYKLAFVELAETPNIMARITFDE